jgi:hypothetical protein
MPALPYLLFLFCLALGFSLFLLFFISSASFLLRRIFFTFLFDLRALHKRAPLEIGSTCKFRDFKYHERPQMCYRIVLAFARGGRKSLPT